MKSENSILLVFGLVLVLGGGVGVVLGLQEYFAIQQCYNSLFCNLGVSIGLGGGLQQAWDTVYLYAGGGGVLLLVGLVVAATGFTRESQTNTTSATSQPSVQNQPSNAYCRNCGQMLQHGSQFCPRCGRVV